MPRLRDPQGHKVEVTQEQFDGLEPIVCDRCGWTRPATAKPQKDSFVGEEEEQVEDSRS